MTHQMLVDPGEVVVLLPAATRYEQEGGGTSTTTERRVAFSPEIPGPRVGEARSEWQIFADVARRGAARARAARSAASRADAIRAEIARVVPTLRGHRAPARDRRRDPGRRRAPVRGRRVPDRRRPGPLRGRRAARPRRARGPLRAVDPAGQAVQLDGVGRRRSAHRRAAATRCSSPPPTPPRSACATATPVLVRVAHGEMRARVHVAPIRPGNVQAFFPEANPLLAPTRARADLGRARLQRGRRGGPGPMTPDALLELLRRRRARGARRGRRRSTPPTPRARTERARPVRARPRRRRRRAARCCERAPRADRERGVGRARARGRDDHGRARSRRRLDELLARHPVLGDVDLRARRRRSRSPALVVNQATGERTTAVRGGGAFRDGVRAARVDGDAGRGRGGRALRARRRRAAVEAVPRARLARRSMLCDIAAGGLDGFVDSGPQPRAVGLSRRLPRVRRSRRRRARRERTTSS